MLPRIRALAPSSMIGASPCSSGVVMKANTGPWWRYTLGAVAEDADIEASGLLDGLDGAARQERAELIDWLFGEGFTVEQIRTSIAPMLLPAGRIVGDDGTYVSARQICEET